MSTLHQVYVNIESRQYLVRVWGKTRERGDFRQASELQTLCRNVFARRVACAGYLVSQYDFHFGDDFVFVDYPCQRQISRDELQIELYFTFHGNPFVVLDNATLHEGVVQTSI